jgi:hypothetical protein
VPDDEGTLLHLPQSLALRKVGELADLGGREPLARGGGFVVRFVLEDARDGVAKDALGKASRF